MNKQTILCFLLLFSLSFTSCKVYNFTGSSLSPDLKTIAIDNIVNEVGQGPPRLAQNFTERLKDYFQSNTNLRVVKSNADLHIEGAIVGYILSPLAPGANETGTRNRLTMSVKIKYENYKDSTQNVNSTFSQYGNDFDASKSFSSVENDEIEVIFDKLLLDIFQKTTANW
jgi:hypothetical protein